MQYILFGYDDTDSEALNRRMKARDAHIVLGNQMRDRGELLYAVALLSSDGKMIGSVCVVEFQSEKELHDWLKIEPYVIQKVWKSVDFRPCRVGPSFSENSGT